MKYPYHNSGRIGILGGGQLGRMLIQQGMDFDVQFSVLEANPKAPCHAISNFVTGDITDYNSVLRFGENNDLITIEIENVNVDALEELERRGKKIFPQPAVIRTIQDKRAQKRFFFDHGIPTSEFITVQDKKELVKSLSFFPAVNKLARDGYDGRGVQTLRDEHDLEKAFEGPSVLEKQVEISKEIAVIVSRNERGYTASYPPVEMVFHPEKNLLEHLIDPADISDSMSEKASDIACDIIEKLGMVGVLAVEMFVSKTEELLVNEIAPRPHNSGHHTIEAYGVSQYEQHLRAILGFPLGNVKRRSKSAMVNLLGDANHEGRAVYKGLEQILTMKGAHLHLYGKAETKPFRKMGHVTLLDENREALAEKIDFVKQHMNVIT